MSERSQSPTGQPHGREGEPEASVADSEIGCEIDGETYSWSYYHGSRRGAARTFHGRITYVHDDEADRVREELAAATAALLTWAATIAAHGPAARPDTTKDTRP